MIDLGWLGYIEFSWKFFLAVGSIVLIDLVLAGDNAVVMSWSGWPAPSWWPNC